MIDSVQCVERLVLLLQQAVAREAVQSGVTVGSASALIGAEAIVSSLTLVSFIVDVELMLSEDYGLDVTLVSEDALSRSKSPFRTIDTLVEYITELARTPNATG